jgi:L-malate glycosyltransferase
MRVAAAALAIPVIVIEHNTYKDKNFFQHAVDWALSFVTFKIVAVSQGVAGYLSTRQHISKKKIVVIPNGISIEPLREAQALQTRESVRERLGIAAEELVLLHVGRLVAQKDPGLLLAGFAAFAGSAQEPCRLVMVGGGPLMEELKAQAEGLGISDRVLFMGAGDPNPYYLASDIFVSTSRIEGFGLVRAEALWHGLPVVTTVTGGTSELIHEEENGTLVHERTPETVAEGIRRVLAMDPQHVRANARETAERFSIEKTAQAYVRIINESLAV